MSKRRAQYSGGWRCDCAGIGRALAALPMALALAACGTYVPEGATVIKVTNSRIEFDRAELRPLDELRRRDLVRLKWYDENTYITTATLAPGGYTFTARSYTGGGLMREITISPDVDLYEVNAGSGGEGGSGSEDGSDSEGGGPVVRGKLALSPGQRRPPSVSVLFIGPTIELRSASVAADGGFEVKAPRSGMWRIEVHVPGNPPLSYVHSLTSLQATPVDLGAVTLR
jgi:hypothetical protein